MENSSCLHEMNSFKQEGLRSGCKDPSQEMFWGAEGRGDQRGDRTEGCSGREEKGILCNLEEGTK